MLDDLPISSEGDRTKSVPNTESSVETPRPSNELIDEVYQHLRRVAKELLRKERPGQTIQATDLVHEAYLRLNKTDHRFNDTSHFFLAAAQAMRRILVDRARAKATDRRGGGRQRFQLNETDFATLEDFPDFLRFDEAMERLTKQHERAAQVLMLRYFAGLGIEQTAETLGISPASVSRDWMFARTWLFRDLGVSET